MKRTVQTILLLASACGALAQGTFQIVVPNAQANTEGNSSASDMMTASSFRMQMVFDASQFSALSSGPGVSNSLNQIFFRIDGASTFDVLSVFSGAAIRLSTTTRSPDSLSPVFADNIGGNLTTVYSGGVAFGGAYFAGSSPQPFGNSIILTSPFFYTPDQGNLLLDITAGSGQVLFPGALDAQSVVGDSISRVFASSAGAAVGVPDTLGLVARFNFTVIPEPASWLIAVTGLIVFILLKRK